MTLSMWDGVESHPSDPFADAVLAVKTALASQFAHCVEAGSFEGFEHRIASVSDTIDSKVHAAVVADPKSFPLVRQAVLTEWYDDFQTVLAARQDAEQRENARRAHQRASVRQAERLRRSKPLNPRVAAVYKRLRRMAGTEAESQALLARFPESVRGRVEKLIGLTVYGPGYNRNVTENLYSAVRFADFGPSAADDMEYLIRKAEAQAKFGETGEWIAPIHPRETGRQQDMFGGEVQYGYNPNVYNASLKTATYTRDAGNILPGQTILLPGDLIGRVTSVEPTASGSHVQISTDMGSFVFAMGEQVPLLNARQYPPRTASKTAADYKYNVSIRRLRLNDGTIIDDVMGADPAPEGQRWVGYTADGERRTWYASEIAEILDSQWDAQTSWVEESMDKQWRESSVHTAAKVVTLEGVEVTAPDPSASGYYVVSNDYEYLDGSFSSYEEAARVAARWGRPPSGWHTQSSARHGYAASDVDDWLFGPEQWVCPGCDKSMPNIEKKRNRHVREECPWQGRSRNPVATPDDPILNELLSEASAKVGAKFKKRYGDQMIVISYDDQRNQDFVWQILDGHEIVREGVAMSFDDAFEAAEFMLGGITANATRRHATWTENATSMNTHPGLVETILTHDLEADGGSASVFRLPMSYNTYAWVATGRDGVEGSGEGGSIAEAQGQAETFLREHAEMGGQMSMFSRRRRAGVQRLAATVPVVLDRSGLWTQTYTGHHRTAALTFTREASIIHWAVTDESGEEEDASGSSTSVRDVLEQAWDALNKVLDHEPPPAEGVAEQVEQAADATGEAVEQAGGSAPDDADPTGGSEGDAPPADGEKGDVTSEAPSDDGSPAEDATSAEDAPKETDAAPSKESDASDEGGDDATAEDAPSNEKADSGDDNPGTAADPESAPPAAPADAAEGVVDAAEGMSDGDIEGLDPSVMNTGQRVNMTYTLNDGTTGNVDVTFVRENNGVFFFDGPKGEFGIGDRDGVWVDSEGNQFAFSDGDAMEEVTGEDVPEGATVEELDVDLDAPVDDDAEGEQPGQDKSKDEDEDEDEEDFEKKFSSIRTAMRRENPGVSDARIDSLALRAARLSKMVGSK